MIEGLNIQTYVTSVLEEVGIPISFVARAEGRMPLLVYNIKEVPEVFWDDEEKITKYTVTINIYSRDNFLGIKNTVLNLMKEAGFTKKEIPPCIYIEDIGVYNQPMFFNFTEEKY